MPPESSWGKASTRRRGEGIPTLPSERVDLDLLARPEAIVEQLCQARPVLPPGRRLAYHALTGGYILGEVVRWATGETIRDVVTRNRGETVTLPDEEAGLMMVFRTFDRVSFGLIMHATRPMHLGDKVLNP